MADKPRIPTPFDADYMPQLKLGRQIPFKAPKLERRPRFLQDNISSEGKGKQFHMNKARI